MTTLHDRTFHGFGSDNESGVHPDVLRALVEANEGHQPSYGADAYTDRLREVIASHFGAEAIAFPVANGTGANVLALRAVAPAWGSVLCAESAHVTTSESTAVGPKLVAIPTEDGKLTPDLLVDRLTGSGDVHCAQPSVVSISQVTEWGTAYTPDEIGAIAEATHGNGLALHVDGARLANATAYLGTDLRTLTTDAGVDIVTLGGTKNGIAFGEVVVVPRPSRAVAAALPFLRKRATQLMSKTRFVSAQLVALYEGDLWLRLAGHANVMARGLADHVRDVDRVVLTQPVESNAVFVSIDDLTAAALHDTFGCQHWERGTQRWMCSFDTTESDVDEFVKVIRSCG